MTTIKKGLKRGYYVKGQFVAEGSEMDIELKNEVIGSKTRAKAAQSAKQDFGVILLAFSAKKLASLGLPETLIDALLLAQRITDFEGKRRQMQYIGKLLRNVDTEALELALSQNEISQRMPEAAQEPSPHTVWRERLLNDDDAMQAFIAEHPQTDSQQLRALVRQAKKVQASATALQNLQPPQPDKAYAEHQAAKKVARKLLNFLATALGQAGEADEDAPQDEENV